MIGELVDAGESARSADRPELQGLLSYVAEQAVDYVIVHKVDRLARNRYDDAIITARLQPQALASLASPGMASR